MSAKLLQTMMEAGAIHRFHILGAYVTRQQSIADHSWGVAILARYLDPDISKEALWYALIHDVPEIVTGDMPAQVKWRNQALHDALDDVEAEFTGRVLAEAWPASLNEVEYALVKTADLLECAWECTEQALMGNNLMRRVAYRVLDGTERQDSALRKLEPEVEVRARVVVSHLYGLLNGSLKITAGDIHELSE